MTLEELIAAERRAVDTAMPGFPAAKRKRLYAKMRMFSAKVQSQPLPNNVSVDDAWLQLMLRAKDLAGVSDPGGFYLPPASRA
ncbi:hypothetical protein [Sphingomonas asaccharolytica]|uniref:hypothetical protein n=1 Tax=Sphingomonas asaccharolytica TaxID=40681 RepID=UPI00082997EE|nr:hypothetical protein [Sphingomonas asaccharolytica]